tara:strand:- start:6993 stop:7940 length:948 start_codon:yes stop_codon:yes gene_type:complete
MKRKKFLVTGGLGFIGSNISKLLVKKKHDVVIFDNSSRGNLKKISKIKKKVKFIKGDIRNKKLLEKSLNNVDAVVHLAYINGTKYFYQHPVKILEIAIKGIVNILDCCIKKGVKEIYLASSSEVYNDPDKIPTDESVVLKIPDIYNPRYSYGGGKIITELMGIHYGKKFFKKLIIFRPHNVYGPDMGFEHVIPEIIQRTRKLNKKKKVLKIMGTGKETRSFIFIDDFIEGFNLLLSRGKHLNIYNIGTSERISIKKLAYKIAKTLKRKIKVSSKISAARGSPTHRCPNISKLKKLGFKKRYNLNLGLKKTADWYN